MKREPLVSVIIPTFNRAHLLGETIQSVVGQHYQHWELIIIDDGSSDNTEELIGLYQDSRIQYHKFPHTAGFGFVRNLGIRKSRGELISFLDSDDLWIPEKLCEQVKLFLNYPETSYAFGNVRQFGEIKIQTPDFADQYDCYLFNQVIDEKLIFYPSTLMFRREVISKIGLMNESMITGSDLDYLYMLSSGFKGCFLNARLVKIRKHQQNTSSSSLIFGYDDNILHTRNLFDRGLISKKKFRKLLSKYYYKMGLILLRDGQQRNAMDSFCRTLYYTPYAWKAGVRLVQAGTSLLFRTA